MIKVLSEWWEKCHREDCMMLLTDSPPGHIFDLHQLRPILIPGHRVLDIGVGFGKMAQALNEAGMIVDSFDLSTVALDRVVDWTKNRWTDSRQLPSGTYDLAICHLVNQHTPDNLMVLQMTDIIRSLKSDGIFSIQYAYVPNRAFDPKDTEEYSKWGGMCRSPEEMREFVRQAGGKVIAELPVMTFTETPTIWHFSHIQRA